MTKTVLRRAAKTVIAVLLTTTVAVVGAAGPAYAAGWTYKDTMEPGSSLPEDRFFFSSDNENAVGWFEDETGTSNGAHSGSYAAHLSHYYNYGTWVAVGQTVTIAPKALGYPTRCQFSAWVWGNSSTRYNLEVIDPVTWNYITVKQVTQPTALAWRHVFADLVTMPTADVVLRVAYLPPAYTSAAFVDDFTLSCVY